MKDVIAKKANESCGHLARHPGSPYPAQSSPEVADRPAVTTHVSPPGSGRFPHTIGLRLNHTLYATAENALEGAHRVGDYSFTSLPDLIRAALTAYFDGMELPAAPERGGKRRTTIGLDDQLKHAYDALPQRKRGEIVERALRTFLNGGMVWRP